MWGEALPQDPVAELSNLVSNGGFEEGTTGWRVTIGPYGQGDDAWQAAAGVAEVVVNGAGAPRLPHTSSVAIPGLDAQVLLVALDTIGVACSVGSACSSGSTELSPTLRAMQLPHDIVAGSLRFSLGATTTEAEIDEAVRRIVHVVGEMRGVDG